MAVNRIGVWATPPSSADPAGSVSIGAGANFFVLTQQAEYTGDATASCAVGGVAATGVGRFFYDYSLGGDDLHIWTWYWDEAAIAAMSGSNISYSDAIILQKKRWSYASFQGVRQSAPIAFSSAAGEAVTASSPLVINTSGASGDYVFIPTACRGTDTIEWDANISEVYDEVESSAGGARFGLADTSWNSSSHSTSQATTSRTQIALAGIIAQADTGITGSGSATAPLASATGLGALGDNNLINPQPTVSGVGERVIVWQGVVNLVAPKATTSVNATFDLIFNDPSPTQLETQFIDLYGFGIRTVTGSGGVSAPTPTTVANDASESTWYTSKTVYFLGA